MDNSTKRSRERLALLLAGGGRRRRQLVAHLPPTGSIFDHLARGSVPRAVVAEAQETMSDAVPRVLERVAARQWRWLTPEQADYPPLLAHSSDPPLGLFVRGTLTQAPAVAVVGARRATPYGLEVAEILGRELAAAGVDLVSGMARGIDGAAHEACLAGGGRTLAVWGAGPDRVYPPEHGSLAERIAARGALLTEYPPGTPPRRHHFPERNRVLAGLSRAVIVVEAASRSGALLTARDALDEGREVLAVPGSILSPLSAGPNALIRMGARPLLTARDVAEVLELPQWPTASPRPEGSTILEHFRPGEAVTVDQLARRSGHTVHEILPLLLEEELSTRVQRLPDGRFRCVGGR